MKPFDYFQYFLDNDDESTDWSFKINSDDVKKYCKHEWAEMGFMHSKIVCRNCDVLKLDWDKYLEGKKK